MNKYNELKMIIIRVHSLRVLLFVMALFCLPTMHISYGSEDEAFITDYVTAELFDHHGSIMLIMDAETGDIVCANQAALEFYGYEEEVLLSMNIDEINTLSTEEVAAEIQLAKEEARHFFEFEHLKMNGTIAAVEVHSYPFTIEDKAYLYSIINDVTEIMEANTRYDASVRRQFILAFMMIVGLGLVVGLLIRSLKHSKLIEAKLKVSEQGYENLFTNMLEGYALHEIITDDHGKAVDYRFLQVNRSFEEYTGLKGDDIVGRRVLDVLPSTEQYWIDTYGRVALEDERMVMESYSQALDKYYSVSAYNVGFGKFITVFVDISDAKHKENEIHFLNEHDQLTGLYNRRAMENKLEEIDVASCLPLSIIMADVNGLKLTNDAFGHNLGDQLLIATSEVFNKVFREDDVISRIGGDEFLVLLPNTGRDEVLTLLNHFSDAMKKVSVGPIQLSVSFGDATKRSVEEEVQFIYKKAEDRMYRNKLIESREIRTKMVEEIFEKIVREYSNVDKHQQRVGHLAMSVAHLFDVTEAEKAKLIEASFYHDVGFVAIDRDIVNKSEPLIEDETQELRRHPECGYRMLRAIPEYAETADVILAHHENFDGSGYPKNLRGGEIPYLSRIIAVLDAYDAMVSGMNYKGPLNQEEAIEELKACSGSQFDPIIVNKFIDYLDGKS